MTSTIKTTEKITKKELETFLTWFRHRCRTLTISHDSQNYLCDMMFSDEDAIKEYFPDEKYYDHRLIVGKEVGQVISKLMTMTIKEFDSIVDTIIC